MASNNNPATPKQRPLTQVSPLPTSTLAKGCFIAGTSTEVGKTWVTRKLKIFLEQSGYRTCTQKWVQTGDSMTQALAEDLSVHDGTPSGLISTTDPLNTLRCPYRFQFPASPHFAARMEHSVIDAENIVAAYQTLLQSFDRVLVEGSGGLMVPYTPELLQIDLIERLRLPVILVFKNELGCINHTLLSLEALRHRKIPVLAVLANTFDTVPTNNEAQALAIQKDNCGILQTFLPPQIPLLSSETSWEAVLAEKIKTLQ